MRIADWNVICHDGGCFVPCVPPLLRSILPDFSSCQRTSCSSCLPRSRHLQRPRASRMQTSSTSCCCGKRRPSTCASTLRSSSPLCCRCAACCCCATCHLFWLVWFVTRYSLPARRQEDLASGGGDDLFEAYCTELETTAAWGGQVELQVGVWWHGILGESESPSGTKQVMLNNLIMHHVAGTGASAQVAHRGLHRGHAGAGSGRGVQGWVACSGFLLLCSSTERQ